MILCVDTSHFDPPANWQELKNNGVVCMYTKATQGGEFVDWTLPSQASGARAVGILNGAYHFFMANVSDKIQTANFFKTIDGMKFDLPFILDWENGSVQGQTADVQIARAELILDAMEIAMKADPTRTTPAMTTPWIYMGLDLALELKLPARFARYPLIVADYSMTPAELPVIAPWGKPIMQQFTDSDHLMGVSPGHTIDANWFLGSMLDLRAYCPSP